MNQEPMVDVLFRTWMEKMGEMEVLQEALKAAQLEVEIAYEELRAEGQKNILIASMGKEHQNG